MTDDELVDAFADACLKAGLSNSGLCIHPSASHDWSTMQSWRTILKERFKRLREELQDARETGNNKLPVP